MPPSTADPTPLLSRDDHSHLSPFPPPPADSEPSSSSDHSIPIPPAASSTLPPLSSLPYPGDKSGLWSLLLFTWVQPILDRGRVGPLTPSDLFLSPSHLLSATYTRELQEAYRWYSSQPSPHPSNLLLRAIVRAYRQRYFVRLWSMRCVLLLLTIIRPFILRQLLLFISDAFVQSKDDWDAGDQLTVLSFTFASWRHIDVGVYWAVLLSVITLVMAFLNHHFWWHGVQLALTVRGACIGLLYLKSSSMHWSHRAEYSSGRISNLASVDGDNLMNFMWGAVHELIAAPILIVLCVAALLWVLGVSALVGVATLIASLCVTSYLARWQSYLQDTIMHISDRRVSSISELLTSIKLIKLYSWQFPFSEKIAVIRHEQESSLYRSTAIGAVTRTLGLSSPLFVSFASFAVYSALGNTLDATTAFTSLLLFNQLKEPLGKLPECITSYVKMWISQQRIQAFLNCSDKEAYVEAVDGVAGPGGGGKGVVSIEDGEFDWGGADEATSSDPTSSLPHDHSPLSHAHADVEARSPPPTLAAGANSSTTPSAALLPGMMHRSHSDDDVYHSMDVLEPSLELSAVSDHPSSAPLPATAPPTPPILSSINLSIPSGSLVMIVGSVGSGKSSLLQALLGEMHRRKGVVKVSRRVAYTSQLAFLQSASIRSNILYGLPYDADLYERVLYACALVDDLSRFPAGDATLVGENGLVLSGGQKMRLVLARAVYSQADVYLCDEPLGAVDAHVGLHIFDHVFAAPHGMLAGKTVLLVTHQLQYSPRCDLLLLMQHGRIVERGSYDELQAKGFDFRAIVTDAHTGAPTAPQHQGEEEVKEGTALVDRPRSPRQVSQPSSPKGGGGGNRPASPDSAGESVSAGAAAPTSMEVLQSSTMGSEDITTESLNVGKMGWQVYRAYFASGAGLLGWLTVMTLVVTSQVAVVGSDYVLAWLTTAGVEREADPDSSLPSQGQYLLAYLVAVLIATVLLAARSLYLAYICTKAGANLHHRLFFGLLRAPQHFHESTPSGRVLNRCGKDMDVHRSAHPTPHTARTPHTTQPLTVTLGPVRCLLQMVDSQLPGVIQDIFACAVSVAGTVALTVLVTPLSLPVLLLIFGLYLLIQRSYRPSSVALKRLESITRSPIYQHFGETANGLATIRSYRHAGAMDRAVDECYHRVDLNTRIYFMSFAVHRWMGLRLETLGAATVLFSSVIALFLLPSLSPGLVGLVITTSLGLSGQLHWLVRQRTEMEVQLNAVERIVEYASLPPEESDERWQAGWEAEKGGQARLPTSDSSDKDPNSTATLIPPADWPTRGEIRFHHLTCAYRPPPHDVSVLHDVVAVIAPGEKVGIVGRTGAGQLRRIHTLQLPSSCSSPLSLSAHQPLPVGFPLCCSQVSRRCRWRCSV